MSTNNAKQLIRELVEEVIEEMTGTSSVSIPLGKGGWGKGGNKHMADIAKNSIPGSKVTREKESDDCCARRARP